MQNAAFKVYLAGPITGLDYEGSSDWRKLASEALADLSRGRIAGYSPMRGKDFLKGRGIISSAGYTDKPMATQRAIMTRDYNDVKTSDLVLFNLLGATRVSIGTMMELAWTFPHVVPTVALIEATGNVHSHLMADEAMPVRTDDFDEAIGLVVRFLLP